MVPILQLPVGPELFIIGLMLVIVVVPVAIVGAGIVLLWKRLSSKAEARAARIDELENRVEELEEEES